jgi:hypothetical protein
MKRNKKICDNCYEKDDLVFKHCLAIKYILRDRKENHNPNEEIDLLSRCPYKLEHLLKENE